jgi:hypothetical protein
MKESPDGSVGSRACRRLTQSASRASGSARGSVSRVANAASRDRMSSKMPAQIGESQTPVTLGRVLPGTSDIVQGHACAGDIGASGATFALLPQNHAWGVENDTDGGFRGTFETRTRTGDLRPAQGPSDAIPGAAAHDRADHTRAGSHREVGGGHCAPGYAAGASPGDHHTGGALTRSIAAPGQQGRRPSRSVGASDRLSFWVKAIGLSRRS